MPAPSAEQRRFPRIPFARAGEIEIRGKDLAESERVPVSFLTVSCEGVGLKIKQPPTTSLHRGTSVILHFTVGEHALEIPGRIAWASDAQEVGIKLQLALATAATRHAFAAWIVDTTKRAVS